jgi:threonine dehydratase
MSFPISLDDVRAAAARIAAHLPPTPVRNYPPLDALIGCTLFVKHEDVQPTNSFKARNNLSVLTALPVEKRARGVIAATRGNHGLGLAYAAKLVGAPAVICVPLGNNPEKNEAIRALGAEVVEEGADYDASIVVAERLARERGLTMIHSTNDPLVIAGAGTLTLELFEQEPQLDALVMAVGGGSQAVGALTVARALRPSLEVFGVQAERASACHDSWHKGERVNTASADTFADGLATRSAYALTFPALEEGLAGFVTVSEAELAEAVRKMIRYTHHLAEGAGAAGLAGAFKLRDRLAQKRVAIVLSGSNIDEKTLRRILDREL